MSENYGKDSIRVLSDLQHVKERYGMYIGENKDPRSLFAEVFDNAIDELHNGAKSVDIYVDTSTNTYRVVDTGRGIPIGQIPIPDSDLTEEVLKVLTSRTGSGAKFDNSTFKIRSGMNGVGLAVVSSLSSKVTYKTTRDGKSVICTYVNGEFSNLEYQDVKNTKLHGVEVIFTVDDSSIFQSTEVPLRYIIDRCKIAAMFLKGGKLNLYVDNEAIDLKLNSVFELLGKDDDSTDKFEIYDSHTIEVSNSEGESWSVSFRFNSSNNYRYKAFTNLLVNYQGGTHEKVAIRCIRRAFLNIFDKNKELAPGDVTGLDLIVSCLIKDPNFSSQTKDYLVVNNNVFKELDANLYTEIDKYFWKHRGLYSKIYDKFVEIKRKLANLKANKEIMNVIKVADESEIKKGKRPSAGVGKLIECTSKDIKGTELHIVEGSSASGCVNFDTEIYDVNFNRLKIGELAKIYEDPNHKPYYTFSCSPEGVIEVSKIKHCWKTKTTDKLVRITFDNGEMVECTPDHRFMMRDGTYKPAEKLVIRDSLMTVDNSSNIIIVMGLEWIEGTFDVYDIEVYSEYHNFPLASGVFIHNSFIKARDPRIHAILPLRGKILNTTKVDSTRAFNNQEIRDITNAVGTGILDKCNPDLCRYEKIIISCFTGDTVVRMLDGNHRTFEELVKEEKENPGKIYEVYSLDSKGNVVVGKGKNPRITKYVDRLIKVTLSDGTEIKSTPEHLFMKSTGKYVEAKDLSVGDSMMITNFSINDQGYEYYFNHHTGSRGLTYQTINSDLSLDSAKELRTVGNLINSVDNYNHTIVSIEEVVSESESAIPVYDITVDEHHNFMINTLDNSGLVVHNCDSDS